MSGNPVSLHWVDPINYPDINTAPVQGMAHDLDQVLGHEFGHGILGLSHFAGIMANNYGIMSEFPIYNDIIRGSFKIPRRNVFDRRYQRMKAWLYSSSERD